MPGNNKVKLVRHVSVAFPFPHTAGCGQPWFSVFSTGVLEYNYTVDKLGRTTRTDELIGGMGTVFKVFQDFDAVGNRTVLSVDVPDEWSDITLYKNTYTFDGLDRLDNVQQFDVAGGHVVADKRVNYVYNALSQVTYINRFHNLTGGNGAALRTRPKGAATKRCHPPIATDCPPN